MPTPTTRPTFAAIKAALPAGERIVDLQADGTIVLQRNDYSIGRFPNARYVVSPRNAVRMRKLSEPVRADAA
jgi:hypothetical protein